MKAKSTLDRTHWIAAAFRALTRGGPGAIKVEAIARELKVSKGSFYWHFKDVGELRRQMIAHWQAEATLGVIAMVDQATDGPADRLRQLIGLAIDGRDEAYGGPQVEAAIRDWARYDAAVLEVLGRVDERRIGYVEALLRESGQAGEMAAKNARLLYGCLLGLQQLAYLQDSPDMGALMDLLEMVLRAP